MGVTAICVGPLQVNCYLLANGLIVDPGDEPETILARIEHEHCTPRAIALTHAHVDHIRAAGPIARHYGIPVLLHPADFPLYHSPMNALPPWVPAAADLPEPRDIRTFEWTAFGAEILETPGHSPGSVCIHFPEAHVLFSGDTLFAGSIGRTDLPGGNLQQLRASILDKLYRLPPETRVLPGHGPATRIDREMQENPFVPAQEQTP